MSDFGMTPAELDFLASHVKPTDTVFEYGSGRSTLFLAPLCRRITSVDHIPQWAAMVMLWAANTGHHNVSVLCIPPDYPYADGTDDDGDLATFKSYVECFNGHADVILIDGRARCEVAKFILERAQYYPGPSTRVFVHDCDREAYRPVFEMFHEEARCERLALLRMRTG